MHTLRKGDGPTKLMMETAQHLLDTHVPDDEIEIESPEQRALRKRVKVAPETQDAPKFDMLDVATAINH